MEKQLYFSRQRKKYHFFLYENSNKILGKITEECVPFSIGDTFKINSGEFKGTYLIKSINAYSNVNCVLKPERKNNKISREALDFLEAKNT